MRPCRPWPSSRLSSGIRDEYVAPTSFQISQVKAGTGANNTIPPNLEVWFNFRFSTESSVGQMVRTTAVPHAHGVEYDLAWSLSGEPFLSPGRADHVGDWGDACAVYERRDVEVFYCLFSEKRPILYLLCALPGSCWECQQQRLGHLVRGGQPNRLDATCAVERLAFWHSRGRHDSDHVELE